MSRLVTVVYDDRQIPPPEIDSIIGAARFSAILRKRVSLGEDVRRACVSGGATDLFHLMDERDALHLVELIEGSQANRTFLRLPSGLMPTRAGELAAAVEKGRYVLQSCLLGRVFGGEAVAMLTAADAIRLLRARDAETLRQLILNLAACAPAMLDHCGFVDLRRPEVFLDFMSDATEARHFNTTRRVGATFRKRSSNIAKMEHEFRFFHIVPDALKVFLLPTFDFVRDDDQASYAMERLNIPDAALQFIHSAFNELSFAALVERFFSFIAARPAREIGASATRDRAGVDILGKMDRRLNDFLATEQGSALDRVLHAAGPLGDLRCMHQRADALVREAIRRDRSSTLAVGHGDPCFSNILFDRRIGLFRLIDPRGARTLEEAWMHPLYDIAKFSHSALGGYDFVNNDLFDCSLNEQLHLQLTLTEGGPPDWCRTIVQDRIEAEGYSLFVIRAYELSLFMSMLPLHTDHARKLSGFALIACQLIQTLEGMR